MTFNNDGEAWAVLVGKVTCFKGVLKFKELYEPTKDDWDAVQYLCDEWDYAYDSGID